MLPGACCNSEWSEGYIKRFVIGYVDFKSQQRLPKLSAAYYKQIIAKWSSCSPDGI